MLEGQISTTALFVAYLRALGTLSPQVPGFADPVAAGLLPDAYAKRVARARARLQRAPGRSPFPFWFRGMGPFIQFRTVVLDRALQAALPIGQLVILGAGLDGRAWRLPGLAATTVFEVDHPATQGLKRARTARLAPTAREVRFVPVDFRTDDLTARLDAAGFDRSRPAFWLCEGVAMYLSTRETLGLLAATSALAGPGSRLALTYLGQDGGKVPWSPMLSLLTVLGEPVRSAVTSEWLEQAGATAGWLALADTGIADWQPELAPDLAVQAGGFHRAERIWLGARI